MENNEEMVEIGSFVTYAPSGQIKTTMYMEAKAFDKNEVKKDLYKSKNMAKFSHYVSGNLYYKVELSVGTYQFPISTVEHEISYEGDEFYQLSEDLGTTTFESEMKGSDLNRWISKAIDKDEFIKVG
jgi:S-methylmethionine-dependent homocysteine/selenocysteine methylase